MDATCQHLGPLIGHVTERSERIDQYGCQHPRHTQTTLAACAACPHYLASAPSAPQRGQGRVLRHPLGVFENIHGLSVDLRDLYYDASAFLVLGGPSAKQLPLEQLGRRGVLIFSVNNCPGVLPYPIRPHVWVHEDPTHKMHNGLWLDPAILKFSPIKEWAAHQSDPRPWQHTERPAGEPVLYKGIRRRGADGQFEFIPELSAKYCPGVIGYHRNTAFFPERWLWEPSLNRGNDLKHALGHAAKKIECNGWPQCINTLFTVLRLAFYLGISRLYLVGCDFRMDPAQPYGHGQGKDAAGCQANNDGYAQMNTMLDALRPHLEAAGMEVLNTNPASGCWSFEFIDFAEAIEQATADVPQQLDTAGWYDTILTERAG